MIRKAVSLRNVGQARRKVGLRLTTQGFDDYFAQPHLPFERSIALVVGQKDGDLLICTPQARLRQFAALKLKLPNVGRDPEVGRYF